MTTAPTGTAVLPVPVKIVRADPALRHGPAKKIKTVSEVCSIILRALSAARSTRDDRGVCHAIVDGGRHVFGMLRGVTRDTGVSRSPRRTPQVSAHSSATNIETRLITQCRT
jgi:hypothetical protein